jgi:apolipoprotein N-acyltransferase
MGTVSGVLVAHWILTGLQQLGVPHGAALSGLVAVPAWVSGLPWGIFGASLAILSTRWPCAFTSSALVLGFALDLGRSHLAWAAPWALLGHSQWAVPGVAQLAALGGVPVISALLAGTSASLGRLLGKSPGGGWRESARSAMPLVCVYVALLGLGAPLVEWARQGRAGRASYELLLVQPNIPVVDRWEPSLQHSNLAIAARLTSEAITRAERRPDLVLWPETLLTTPLEESPALLGDVLERVRRVGAPFVLGAARSSQEGDSTRYRNAALWIDPLRGITTSFDKTRAVPLVEAPPGSFAARWMSRLLGLPEGGRRVEEGSLEAPLGGPIELATLLCYEAIYPDLAAARRTPRTVALVNLANDSWFGSASVSRQQVAYASFRAIEQRLPLVRVALGGESVVIDSLGRIVAALPHEATGVLWVHLEPESVGPWRDRCALLILIATAAALGWVASGSPVWAR